MQAGDDNINRVIYIPFTTMSDLKDTHYLDSIWFNYETPAYEDLEQHRALRDGHRSTSSTPPTGAPCWCLTSWSRSTSSK